jgi:eukaryotic-like serine/threonine-protein kinase
MRSARRVDGRTDIWALGTVVHELLTGAAPFVAKTMTELCAMILTDATPSLRAKRADVPEELDRVVAKCLEKDPDRRYPNVLETARALAPFGTSPGAPLIDRIARVSRNAAASVSSTGAPSAPSFDDVPLASSSASLSLAKTTVDPGPPPSSGRRLALIAAVFAVLALVGGTLLVISLNQRATNRDEPASVTIAPSATAAAEPPPKPTPEPEPEPEPAPPLTAPSIAASQAPVPSVQVRRPAKTPAAAAPRASGSVAAPVAPVKSATPKTIPAATATSRYD